MAISTRTTVINHACEYCGKPIVLSYHVDQAHQPQVRFCGMTCYHAHRRSTVGSEPRICARCGQEHRNKAFNYCLACRREMASAKPATVKVVDERSSRVCLTCGKTFYKSTNINATQWAATKYCSRSCFGASQRKAYDTCEACGEPITTVGVKRGSARYCSRKCYADASSGFKPWPDCLVCGDTVPRRTMKFCSAECFNEWHRGPNHPLYIDGTSVHHQGVVWVRRAAEVRERDQVCRHCGKPPKLPRPLDVHHVVPWRITHDDSLENLIALCRSCHKKADHQIRLLAAVVNSLQHSLRNQE